MGKILTPDEFNKVVQELTEEQLAKVFGGVAQSKKTKARTTGTPVDGRPGGYGS